MNLVEYVAHQTRKWAEKHKPHEVAGHLGGMCGIASAELFLRLKRRGIKSVIVMNKWGNHVFLRANGIIYDVTATQFGKYPEVFITLEAPSDTWTEGTRYKSVESFIKAQSHWPAHQQFKLFKGTSYGRNKGKKAIKAND